MILDTDVVSGLMRPEPRPIVPLGSAGHRPGRSARPASRRRRSFLYGIALLPAGKRRDALAAAAGAVLAEDFAGRVLPFDSDAAGRFAAIAAARRRAGDPIEDFDAQTAAIALAADAAVATRDAGGFAGCGLAAVDPRRAA